MRRRGVSIIVPAYNAEATLGDCLDALGQQDYDAPTEIIVVDNRSTDGTARVARGRAKVRVIGCARIGPAAARNDGAAAARYNLLAFTDADCVPSSDWLSQLVSGLTPDLSGIGGPLVSAYAGVIPEFVAEISFNQEAHVAAPLPYLATSNALYRREAFDAVGAFDETFDIAGGEDNDFGWRLSARGLRIGFAPGACVLHKHPLTVPEFILQRMRYGYGELMLIHKHGGRADLTGVRVGGSLRDLWWWLCGSVGGHTVAWAQTRRWREMLGIVSDAGFFCGYLIASWRKPHQRSVAQPRTPAPLPRPLPEADSEPMCLKPWTSFELDDQHGNVLPCCWTKRTVGNLKEHPIDEIWNGRAFQDFRRAMLDGRYEEICPSDCPHRTGAAVEALPESGASPAYRANLELLRQDVAEQRVELRARPISIRLLPSIRCNLECIMCWQRVETDAELPERFYDEVDELLPYVGKLVLQGGEPLMIRRCRELIARCKADTYPDIDVDLITNGTFLSDQFVRSISGVRMSWLFVSLDAASAPTYRQIRGGDFESICDGIRRVRVARPDIRIIVGFVVMEENVDEMLEFVKLAEGLGAEFEFSPLNAAFRKGDDFALPAFRQRLASSVRHVEQYLADVGLRNRSLEPVKHRMWNTQFRMFRASARPLHPVMPPPSAE